MCSSAKIKFLLPNNIVRFDYCSLGLLGFVKPEERFAGSRALLKLIESAIPCRTSGRRSNKHAFAGTCVLRGWVMGCVHFGKVQTSVVCLSRMNLEYTEEHRIYFVRVTLAVSVIISCWAVDKNDYRFWRQERSTIRRMWRTASCTRKTPKRCLSFVHVLLDVTLHLPRKG